MEPKEKKRKVCMELPMVDFSPFLRNDGVNIGQEPTPEQANVARQINDVNRHHGFLILRNSGIDKALLAEVFSNAQTIFELPLEDKLKLKKYDPNTNTGYTTKGAETHNRRRGPDMMESFGFREQDGNNFQNAPESLESATRRFWAQVKDSGMRYAKCCGLALGLPRDYFSSTFQKFDLCTVRMLRYPALEDTDSIGNEDDLSSSIRIGEHTDFGAFTYLFVRDYHAVESQGLQVKGIAGSDFSGDRDDNDFRSNWTDVVYSEGLLNQIKTDEYATIIVNTGALIARWTNDTWQATAHRVVVTEESAKADRYSIACFFDPDKDSMCQVHESFVPVGEEAKYPAISSLDYLLMKLNEASGLS